MNVREGEEHVLGPHREVQLGQELHHGEAEARALELPCEPAVDLAEGPEQPLQIVRRDADARVRDADLQKLRERALGQR